ncbi:hypothetical protein DVH26_33215 [Paenibacillus sp. H1-7]|uniref:hypothetical protein n=1 Tax=Paenibacillus sp. H1-7 TaxID=2282849 RepID=UPI001EF762C8|nr:hypothetical protein [Paenibacillus sp. H1-7]ULL18872.1 hypothetical protein DVH26_33215 [Paenibacillus sp. H1-7]
MQWEQPSDGYRITKVVSQRQDGECILTWQWPKDVEYVYIYSFEAGTERHPEDLSPQQLKLFTREEYKSKSGYRDKVDYIGLRGYRIFPCVRRDGRLVLLMQADESNLVLMNGGRARIVYSLKYGSKLFSKFKTARIQLFCEIAVPQDALCYVKKEGANPSNKDDGIAYPFMSDFPVGRSVLQEIEIGRNDFIRIFFTDKKYSELFSLSME